MAAQGGISVERPRRPGAGPVRRKDHQGATLLSYAEVYRASSSDRIRLIKDGVRAADAKRMIAGLKVDQSVLLGALNLKIATVNRKAAADQVLPIDEGERVLGVARLVGQLQVMVEEGGNPDGFDAPAWLSRWLREPLASLGGVRPLNLLDTMEGQALVSRALSQSGSGAYA